jgi:hypothetical protein
VSLGATSTAFMFSTTCSGLLAPVITELTFVFLTHHHLQLQRGAISFQRKLAPPGSLRNSIID